MPHYSNALFIYVLVGFEILNRFETYVLNTVDDAMDVIGEVENPNLGFHWDTSHAHIDEADVVAMNRSGASAAARAMTVASSPSNPTARRNSTSGRGWGGSTPWGTPRSINRRILASPCRAAARGLARDPALSALARFPVANPANV